MNIEEITRTYKFTKSMEKTAELCGIRWQKVRKILITEGLYETPLSLRINHLHKECLSVDVIAKELNIGLKTVNSYLPYEKGAYLIDNPTNNALRIRKHRIRKLEVG